MSRFTIMVLALFWSCNVMGQGTNLIDSLLTKLETAKEDTMKVEILLRLFSPTAINDLELAYEYANRAQQLSEQLSFDKGIAAAYQRKGIYWGYKGNVNNARKNYLKAIEVHERLDHPVVAATLIHNLGHLYQEQGIYDSALVYCNRAAEIFVQNRDSLKYASSLDLFSSIHEEQGNYYLSLKNATEAANLFRKYGDELREADALMKIGSGYHVHKAYWKGIEYYEAAIELYRKYNDLHWENYAWQKIARSYLMMEELDLADSIIDYSMMLSDSLGATQMIAEAYDIKGELLFEKGLYQKALEYLTAALDINKDAEDSTFNATEQIAIARCLQNLGQYDDALNAYLKVLPISLKMDVKENVREIYENVSQIYDLQGKQARAYEYYQKFVEVKDSIYANEKSRQFADMQTKYDTERKERDIKLKEQTITILQQEAKIQNLIRMRLIVSIIVVVIVLLLGFYVIVLKMRKNKLKQEIENERLMHELDLKKRELTTRALHIIQKNELLEDLQREVIELESRNNHQGVSFREISRLINTNRLIDRDWENFKSVFEQVHPEFFQKLQSSYENISSNELRMAAMMKMNLNTKEMASILNITPDSVKKARYRMRKKLNLEAESNVQEYLMKL